jgi:YesN/AraC family two-component response regulator
LKEIKRIRPHLPVIFITAYGDEEVAVKAFRYGAKDYLKKPFNHHELLHTIQFSLSLISLDKKAPRRVLTAELDPVACYEARTGNGSVTKYNLQKALIYINNNFMTKISLDTVAKKACTSKYHLSREFKKSLGCTYQEYLKKLRLEKARTLLKNTNLSVTEAAFSAGYADLTNFERIFKKITGCTPRQYKNTRSPG